MKNLLEIQNDLEQLSTSDEKFIYLVKKLEDFGVVSFCYGAFPFVSEIENKRYLETGFIKTTHKEEWQRLNAQGGGIEDDVTVQRIMKDVKTTLWSDRSFLDEVTEAQWRQFEIDDDLGMSTGVSFALMDFKTNSMASGIGLNIPDISATEFPDFWSRNESDLVQLAQLLESHCFLGPESVLIDLSERERDCLNYLAVGFRPVEVAFRMKISPRTLEKHISSAKDKLKSRTRDHAIAKALRLGIINP